MLGDEIVRAPASDDPTLVHDRDLVGEPLGLLDVVRGHEDGHALRAQLVDECPQLRAHLRVEPDGRFVEEQELGPVHEAAGDEQAASHPARELVDHDVGASGQVGHFERALDRGVSIGTRHSVEAGEHRQVLTHRELEVEVVELGHHPAAGASLLGLAGQAMAEHLDLAGVRDRLGGQHAHRRRLASAIGAE